MRPQPAFLSAVYGHVGLHLVGGTSTKAIRYRPVEGVARHVSQPGEVVELDQVCPVSRVPAVHHQEEVLEACARPQPRQLKVFLWPRRLRAPLISTPPTPAAPGTPPGSADCSVSFIAVLPVDRSSTGHWLGLLVSFIAVLYVDRSSTGLLLGDMAVDKPESDRHCPESETTCVSCESICSKSAVVSRSPAPSLPTTPSLTPPTSPPPLCARGQRHPQHGAPAGAGGACFLNSPLIFQTAVHF